MNKLVVFLFLLTTSFTVFGHNVLESMKKCTLEQNALKRLVCFDTISQHLTPSPKVPATPKQVIAASAEPAQQPIETTTAENEFGLEHKPKTEKLADSIVANVLSIKKNPYKKYIITLDNAHVWKQSDSTKLKISVGEAVIVKRGSLGSFFMSKEGTNKRLRVKRLK